MQIKLLFVCLIFVTAVFGTKEFYYLKGFTDATSEYQTATIDALNHAIGNFNAANIRAKETSLTLNNSISELLKIGHASTGELRNALKQTAHLRRDCIFDDDVMRITQAAADRADNAASGGFRRAMPSSTKAK